jgi:uncharacterized protein DUF559
MTPAEEILWARLRGSRFHGAKFKRQVPFDRYVADFYCRAAKLAVEIDGKQHEWFADYDSGRTQVLEAYGVRLVRFTIRRSARNSIRFSRASGRSFDCHSAEVRSPHPYPSPVGRGRVPSPPSALLRLLEAAPAGRNRL